jgi:hypothetical protein
MGNDSLIADHFGHKSLLPQWVAMTILFNAFSPPTHAGMGIVVAREEPYSFKSDLGAILLIVEAAQLLAHRRGISIPGRIAGATWPSDAELRPAP